ncbi:inhibitor of apoptosis-promoting Bax1-domain-containing protein [Entophlyctis helioformis]|nr:inhibitor of apoptosis-promoting Bax1-domain-containing protein [Entophlyctis helioformis]
MTWHLLCLPQLSSSFATMESFFQPPPSVRWDNLGMNLSPVVRGHLLQVYQTLVLLFASTTVGSVVHTAELIPGLTGGILSFVAMFASLVAFLFTPPSSTDTRAGILYAFAFFKGLSLGPVIEIVTLTNPGAVTVAMGATALIFACFSLSVLYSPRRQVFMTVGLLSSLLSTLFWVQLANLFLGSASLYSLELLMGLAAFSLFVVYDTQVIIAKAEMGSKDHLRHALELYSDAIGVFVRILAILQNKRKSEEDSRRRRNRRD